VPPGDRTFELPRDRRCRRIILQADSNAGPIDAVVATVGSDRVSFVLAMLSSAAHGQQTTDVAQLTAAAGRSWVSPPSATTASADGLVYIMAP
jgi:hypothetical protein